MVILIALGQFSWNPETGVLQASSVQSTELQGQYAICPGYIAPAYSGFYMRSNRGADDQGPDFTLYNEADRKAQRMLQIRTLGSSGPEVFAVWGDGTVSAGRQGGRAAFLQASGISGFPAVSCEPYTNPGGCYTHIQGQLKNESFHGAVTLSNGAEPRDAGLAFQVLSRGRQDSYANTVLSQTVYGDVTLWGGSLQPYFTLLPPCVAGTSTLDGQAGEGSIAWWTVTHCLYVCDSEAWQPIFCKSQ